MLFLSAGLASGANAAPPSKGQGSLHTEHAHPTASATPAADAPFWTGTPNVEEFTRRHEEHITRAKAAIDRLLAVSGKRTIENTLQPYDDASLELDAVASQSSLIQNVHPDSTMRTSAEAISQKASAYVTELSLDRRVYDALKGLDLTGLDAETRYYVEKSLREFRLAGVDKDDATRKRIKELSDELVQIGQEFSRNIRSDLRTVTVNGAAELDGLPQDFIDRHKPDAAGKITLTIDYPDAGPVFSYAKNTDVRKRLYMEYNNRGYPKNMAVLDSMISKRYQLATLLGFPSWAEYITANKMVGSAKNAADFIDKIVAASTERANADYRMLLARKQKDVPAAQSVDAWETSYYNELVRRSDYNFDAQSMRPYFPFDEVKEGVLSVSSTLFGVTFKRVADAPVWDPAVECYEMWDGGKLAGRFYLDLHPRQNKYNHAAQFDVHTGVAGKQIPEATLVCNFAGGQPGDPGLMEYGDVRTFFHEFGHLLHTLFAGRHRWIGTGGIRTEHDFVEAPSQMLEEWTQDPTVLATFAKHHQTHEPVPAELVKQMKRANEFGKGLGVRRQMVYAKMSLSCYDRAPSEVNTDALIQDLTAKYQPFAFVQGTHWQCAFGHLDGYSAVYYTYMWSLVIAKDMFSKFDKTNLLDPAVAKQYRDAVLAPGGSAPAADLVAHFLGRPFGFESYRQWLNEAN